MYGKCPRNASKLRMMDKGEKSSAEAKYFAKHIKSLHEEVQQHISKMNTQYKAKIDQKRHFKEFQVGDEVMVHLRKERFPRKTYNKLNMKRFGPCKIIGKRDSGNAYEVELPSELNISPIINILDLIEYHEGGSRETPSSYLWSIPASTPATYEVKEILDT